MKYFDFTKILKNNFSILAKLWGMTSFLCSLSSKMKRDKYIKERQVAFNMDYQQMARNGRNLACKEKKVHKHSYFLTDPLIFKNAYNYYFFNRSCPLRRVPVRPMASHVYGDSPMLYLIWLDSIPNLNFLSWITSNNFSKLTILACGHYWNR